MKLNRISCAVSFLVFVLLVSSIFIFIKAVQKFKDSTQTTQIDSNDQALEKSQLESPVSRFTPTPDPPRALPTLRSEPIAYVIKPGDTLVKVAQQYQVTYKMIVEANNIPNPDLIEVGQVFSIPAPEPGPTAPGFKIIPDSELINGPSQVDFDVADFIRSTGGYLKEYNEVYEEEHLTGTAILERVSREYSVNPRLLLAILEYSGKWISSSRISEEAQQYPAGLIDPSRQGLYKQLAWAANELNRGYYLWCINALPAVITQDGSIIPMNPTINAGSAAVQHLLSKLYEYDHWYQSTQQDGVFLTYNELFGYPFEYAIEPVIPDDLIQPELQLPFEQGDVWSYTSGPHGGWGNGSAWAALDFAPPGESLGCVSSDAWVVAVADGKIIYSNKGMVIQDLDGDGWFQTGWSIQYMHIETRDRVETGTFVKAGSRIGHASCEGGVSTGTHVHLARRYNGEWIPADQTIPFVLDNWVSKSAGTEYDGYLTRDNITVEAINGKSDKNQIQR